MLKRFIDWILEYGSRSQKKKLVVEFTLFALISIPLVAIFVFGYFKTKGYLTELTLSRRGALAELASTMLEEKFNSIIDVGISLSTRVQFRKLIQEGKWDDAIKILERAPTDFSYIDTVALFDPGGIIKAATPLTPPLREIIGKSFRERDYYKGVINGWQPYVSEVFKRAPEPRYNVVSIAIPIKSEIVQGQEPAILGILLLTIKLDTVLNWTREINVGNGGFVYFVDRNGHVAGHPKFSSEGDVVDFSSVPVVKKVLKGERGVEVNYNHVEKEERISAYEPVPKYGWGVIVQQPTASAFVSSNNALRFTTVIYGVIVAFILMIAYFIVLRLGDTIFEYRQREKIFLVSIGDGIIAIDRYWNVTLWNDAAEELTGRKREEVMGKPFREIIKFIRENNREENIAFIEKAMLMGQRSFMENNTKLIRRDGTEIYVGDSASPVFDYNKRIMGAIIIFRDITKEVELKAAREEFNSLASHQLRAPVTVIKGYIELLREEKAGPLNQEQKQYTEQIYQASQNMVSLVNALLNVSRVELGTIAISPEAVYLPDLAEEVIKELKPQIQEKELIFEKNIAENMASIDADPNLAKAIFRNLLSNAIKYTPSKGKVVFEILRKDSDILIKVSDTGLGIPAGSQAKVFTKFFRAENIRQLESSGTGLGLYLVKSILDQAGGKIWFKSPGELSSDEKTEEKSLPLRGLPIPPLLKGARGISEKGENKGTTFYVSLPVSGMKKKEGIKGLT